MVIFDQLSHSCRGSRLLLPRPKGATYVSPGHSPGSDGDQKHQSPNGAHYRNRSGLTLVEMLVSLVCVLMLMTAYTQLFSDVGSKVGEARSMIELSTRMRSAAQRLRSDLEAHTCDMRVWQRPEAGQGYFEIIEGPLCDKTFASDNIHNNGLTSTAYTGNFDWSTSMQYYPLGDTDDVLMFTARSKDGPFVGQVNGTTTQSEVAEVVWYLRPTLQADGKTPADPPTYTLYRRVLLVMPSMTPVSKTTVDNNPQQYDVSMHVEGSNYVGNSLGDLTKRENRTAHTGSFPFPVDPTALMPFGHHFDPSSGKYVHDTTLPTNARYGEDVVLTNVLSFDVQVWDPLAPVYTTGGVAVAPGDPGFNSSVTGNPPSANSIVSNGAYVDLNWRNTAWDPTSATSLKWNTNWNLSSFSSSGHPKSKLAATCPSSATPFNKSWLSASPSPVKPAVYDTWSFHYEMDGISEDGNAHPDRGTDPIAAIQAGNSDYETSPPYPVPLRGVKIRIRCYEPDSRDVREVTVTESFVPQ
jgi:Tfp pilus assembly protein PilV